MPGRARSNIGRRSRRTQNRANERANQSQEQRERQNAMNRERNARSRSRQSDEERRQDQEQERLRLQRHNAARNINPNVQRQRRAAQLNVNVPLNGAGFQYNNAIDYSLHKFVVIGAMNNVCRFCNALKFGSETPGMCCAAGKVRLPELQYPPEPLASLISGTTPESRHFLDNIQMYNSCFQMTSFGATNIISDNFMPTFKVISAKLLNFSQVPIHLLNILHRNYRYKDKSIIQLVHCYHSQMPIINFCKFISSATMKIKSKPVVHYLEVPDEG